MSYHKICPVIYVTELTILDIHIEYDFMTSYSPSATILEYFNKNQKQKICPVYICMFPRTDL